VTGDRVQLQQVILNLLRNASDAMSDINGRPRHLLVTTELEDGGGARVTVRDSGVGLSLERVDSLFDAFYTTKTGGMGIGLFVRGRSPAGRPRDRLKAAADASKDSLYGRRPMAASISSAACT